MVRTYTQQWRRGSSSSINPNLILSRLKQANNRTKRIYSSSYATPSIHPPICQVARQVFSERGWLVVNSFTFQQHKTHFSLLLLISSSWQLLCEREGNLSLQISYESAASSRYIRVFSSSKKQQAWVAHQKSHACTYVTSPYLYSHAHTHTHSHTYKSPMRSNTHRNSR